MVAAAARQGWAAGASLRGPGTLVRGRERHLVDVISSMVLISPISILICELSVFLWVQQTDSHARVVSLLDAAENARARGIWNRLLGRQASTVGLARHKG